MNETIEAEIIDSTPEPDMEPGGLPARFGAICLDLILVTAVFALLLTQIILPEWYPGAMDEMIQQFENSGNANEEVPPPPPSENLRDAIRTSNALSFFFIFLYFTFVPVLFGGGTLGMRIFNLRIQDRDKPIPPSLRSHFVRGAVKTLCLQVLFPFLTLLFLAALRNPQRMAIHDLLARTRVVRGPAFSAK